MVQKWPSTTAGVNLARKFSVPPSLLFIDARTTTQWREKNFFPVLNENEINSDTNLQRSLISKMIALGRENALVPHSRVPEQIRLGLQRHNACSNLREFNQYAREKPLQGMPLAITRLTDKEYQTLQNWIKQGGEFDETSSAPDLEELRSIQQWDAFLNQPSLKAGLSARYLYEHLFLADLYFDDVDTPSFYRIVRSASAPCKPIDVIPTTRPNQDPGQTFFLPIAEKMWAL